MHLRMFTPHAEPPGARPLFLAPLSRLASRLLPALSDAQHSSHSWNSKEHLNISDMFRKMLFGTRKKDLSPIDFPTSRSTPCRKDFRVAPSPVHSFPSQPTRQRGIHVPELHMHIPSLGAPIIKALEALARDHSPAKIPRRLATQARTLPWRMSSRDTQWFLFVGLSTRGVPGQWGALSFSLLL